ncbi:Serine/threonine-protein phosphatase 7 long form-like protein [Senna tora]|uniref:Serine/threonine-protein phosphatase 7 long form-like protein n=1 Tax=Senna tora TaxID=362788 RepID=A0A834SCU1_9FABA|nr:Serine/threonine-protein phosphatase 7 long form-like protein [Senna tora]
MCARGSRGGDLGGANFGNLSQAQTCNRDRQPAISSVSGLAALHSSQYRVPSTADPQLYCPHSAKSLICIVVCIVAYTPPGNYSRTHTGSGISTNSLKLVGPSSSDVAGEAQCPAIPCTTHDNYASRFP